MDKLPKIGDPVLWKGKKFVVKTKPVMVANPKPPATNKIPAYPGTGQEHWQCEIEISPGKTMPVDVRELTEIPNE